MSLKYSFSVIYLSLTLSFHSFSQSISEDEVPLNIVGRHYNQFPNAKSANWQKTYTNGVKSLAVAFIFNKEKYIVEYNMQGKKLNEKIDINLDKLYPSIFSELTLKHGKFKITSLTKNNYYENGKSVNEFYVLSLKTKSSLIDEFLNIDMELDSKSKNLFALHNK